VAGHLAFRHINLTKINHMVFAIMRMCVQNQSFGLYIKLQILFVFFLSSCCFADEDGVIGEAVVFDKSGQSAAYKTSIITLLSGNQNLDNALVQVEGYLSADREGPIVFLTIDHCERYSSFDGIGIRLDKSLTVDWSALRDPDCRRVLVQGKYKFSPYVQPTPDKVSLRIVQAMLVDVNYIADISNG